MDTTFLKDFSAPGSYYRGVPFWALNGKLEPEELRRQIRLMKKMGLGGACLHARIGLETPYLSSEWFDCIKVCIDEFEKQNMLAVLYDEDRWPSGTAGGMVTKVPKHRARFMAMREITRPGDFTWDTNTVAAFTAKVKHCVATNVKPIRWGKRTDKLGKGESILVFSLGTEFCWLVQQFFLRRYNES